MADKSFFEVLEEQMRTEIRAELEREFATKQKASQPVDLAAAKAGQFQTWVASHIEKTYFTPSTKKVYGSPAPRKKPEPVRRPDRELSLEQMLSLELVRRHSGQFLEENFTEAELKSAWRKAALKSHPDLFDGADKITQARATALFRELTAAYETLQAVFETATTKAA